MGIAGHASGEAVVGATLGVTILAGIAVVGRLVTRIGLSRNAGYDDACITVALLFSIATTIAFILQVRYGLGKHQDTLSEDQAVASLKCFWVIIWVYNLAISFTKFSILLQYLRIFPHKNFRLACYIMIGIVSAYSLWTFFSAIFACIPVSYFWNSNIDGHCLDRFAVWFANAGINIATDIATVVLPLPIVKSLNLPPRQKYALMGVFALGGFTILVSILRLNSLYVVSKSTDITWTNPLAAIWSSTEINTGIICSCLPTLKGCVARFFPRLFGSSRSRSRGTTKQYGQQHSAGRQTTGHRRDPTFDRDWDAFGRGLSGPSKAVHKTVIKSQVNDGSSDDLELDTVGSPIRSQHDMEDDRAIQVVTVMQQETERARSRSETDSVRHLVGHSYYHTDG